MIVTSHPRVYTVCKHAAVTALMLGAADVRSATICYPRDQMLSYIERELQATVAANGIVRPYSVMEVWVSDDTGDWLIVTTDLDGNSCIISYGEDFGGRLGLPAEQS